MPVWITAFKLIPWASVLAAAPAVLSAARTLWDARRDRKQEPALNEQIAELHKELTAATELITQLAEQNHRLVQAVAILRMRTRVLIVFVAIMGVGLIALAVAVAAR